MSRCKEGDRTLKADQQRKRVEAARPLAASALELFLSGARLAEHERLVDFALIDYGLRFPAFRRRATNTWLFYDGNPTTTHIKTTKRHPVPDRVDVYCLFCRVLLISPATWRHDYSAQCQKHTWACALRMLAGQMEPGAPNTYRLPEEL